MASPARRPQACYAIHLAVDDHYCAADESLKGLCHIRRLQGLKALDNQPAQSAEQQVGVGPHRERMYSKRPRG